MQRELNEVPPFERSFLLHYVPFRLRAACKCAHVESYPSLASLGESARLFPSRNTIGQYPAIERHGIEFSSGRKMLRAHLACVHMRVWEEHVFLRTYAYVRRAHPPLSHTAGGSVNDGVWHMYPNGADR